MRAVRARTGKDFLVIFRVSSIDLVEGGLTAEEIVAQARAVEAAGADIINQGIGWHEARVPTIAQKVPRGAWAFAARRLKDAVNIPVIASNRINTPAVAEAILAAGDADMVSMARPMLADPEFANKAARGTAPTRSTCASPATRPASISSSPSAWRPAWSIRRRAARSSSTCPCRPGARGSPWWAPGLRASPAR